MACLAVTGATMMCSMGVAPSSLTVLPVNRIVTSTPVANIMDNVPFLNVLPFGMCTSMANPAVSAATSAALGVLTPMPCTPMTTAPWTPGVPTVLVGNMPAVDMNCKLVCSYGGMISILSPGQFVALGG
jgi:hypothetical protein